MILIAVLFIVLGILIKYGKMYFLIAGYNTMSQEDKEKYNMERVANVFWHGMLGMAIIIIVGYLISAFGVNSNIQNYTFGLAMITGVPYLLFASNSVKSKSK